LQAILFGIGGLDITPNGIEQLDTQLSKRWKSLKMTGTRFYDECFGLAGNY